MISIREVARLAGVSASTVSRVINGTAKRIATASQPSTTLPVSL